MEQNPSQPQPEDDFAQAAPEEELSEAENPVAEEDTVTFKRSHFYSVLVVLAFAVGLLTGYVVWGRLAPMQQVAQVAAQQSVEQVAPQPAPTTGSNTGNQDIMAYLVSGVRHFRGDENAPVTLIEFGDFQ